MKNLISKQEIKLAVEWKDHTDIVLTNHHGDTYTSQSEELHDFVTRAQEPLENSAPAPQSGEVMTLEECQSKVNSNYEVYSYSMTTHIRHVKAAELYASQYKAKVDQLQAELEQVKAERNAMREALQEIVELPDLRFGDDYKTDGYALALEDVHRIANKALQSTKQ